MTTTSTELASYLDKSFADWRRARLTSYWRDTAAEFRWPHEQRPSAEDLARRLVADAEFRALRLAGFLQTPSGEFFTDAVEQVSPPFLRPDEELIVAALHLAARMQQQGNRQAGAVAAGAVAFAGYLLWWTLNP